MNTYVIFEEENSSFLISHFFSIKYRPKPTSYECLALCSRIEVHVFSWLKNGLNSISNLLIIVFDNRIVDHSICAIIQSSKYDNYWKQELLFQIKKSQCDWAVWSVVKSECLCKEIISYTSHHACVTCEVYSSIDECSSCECNWEISLLLYKHSY